MEQVQSGNEILLDTALNQLVAILNFDFSPKNAPVKAEKFFYAYLFLAKQGLNTRGGFAKAGAQVAEVKAILDPIITAHMDGQDAIPFEERLADEVNRLGSWRLERSLVDGQLSDKWELRQHYTTETLKDFLLAQAGVLLTENSMDMLRRCRRCGRYIRYTDGRRPDFCPDTNCRNDFYNAERLTRDRKRSRLVQLASLAKKTDLELTDRDKNQITAWVGLAAFVAIKDKLKTLPKSPTDKQVEQVFETLPTKVQEQLTLARERRGRDKRHYRRAQQRRK